MAQIRVVIVDDHLLIREGLLKVLSIDPDISVVGEASDGEDALDLLSRVATDVVLMDVNMPQMSGLAACREIKRLHPQIGVIGLTVHDRKEYYIEMFRSGASAYLLKDVKPSTLIATIKHVAGGHTLLPNSLFNDVFGDPEQTPSRIEALGLTKREVEVLAMLADGKTNREIAKGLHLSEQTVKNHLWRIFDKLGVKDRTQAALYAVKHQITNSE